MGNLQKQAQLQSRQDVVREEVNLFLADGRRDDAIKHYQRKCACSVERAVAFVDAVNKQRMDKRRDEIMSRGIRRRITHAFA